MNTTFGGGAADRIQAGALLDTWSSCDWSGAVRVDRLAAMDRVTVQTANSTYELVVTEPGSADVLVRGGRFFAEFTRARLAGSSLGGSFLKLHTVQRGFRMELVADGRAIVTSPVRDVQLAADRAVHGPLM